MRINNKQDTNTIILAFCSLFNQLITPNIHKINPQTINVDNNNIISPPFTPVHIIHNNKINVNRYL